MGGRAWVAVCAVALAVSSCGGNNPRSGDALADALSYVPADAALVGVVDTDLDGEPVRALEDALRKHALDGKGFEQLLRENSEGSPVSAGDIEAVIGNELVFAVPDPEVLLDDQDEPPGPFIVALRVRDEDKLRDMLPKLELKPAGEVHGADLFGDPEAFGLIAIHEGVMLFAPDRAGIERLVATHSGPAEARFTPGRLDASTRGLSADAPLRIHANLARLVGTPRLRDLRKVRWVDALRTGALTLSGEDRQLVLRAQASTDSEGLTGADLPFRPGTPPVEVPTREDTFNSGSVNQSQTTTFLLSLIRAGRPTGRFARDVAKVEKERRIDFDEEVLRQFDGPSVSLLDPFAGGFAARSTVRDPERMERTLRKIAPDVPRLAQDLDPLREEGLTLLLLLAPDAPVGRSVLGDSDVSVERIDGERSLYRIANLGLDDVTTDEIVFGLLGDVFVVASDLEHARQAVREPVARRPGLKGASAVHARAYGSLRDQMSNALGFDPGPDAELSGTVDANTERLRATARLRMP